MAATTWTGQINTSKKYKLGSLKWQNGLAYVYLKGVASTAVGDAVIYDSTGATSRLSTASVAGPVAIAMAANVAATTFSWYQVFGLGTATAAGTVAADAQLQATATAGQIDDTTTAGKTIIGCISKGAGTAASTLVVQLNFPYYESVAIV